MGDLRYTWVMTAPLSSRFFLAWSTSLCGVPLGNETMYLLGLTAAMADAAKMRTEAMVESFMLIDVWRMVLAEGVGGEVCV